MKQKKMVGLSVILIGFAVSMVALFFTNVPISTPLPCGSNPCYGGEWVWAKIIPFIIGIIAMASGAGIFFLAGRHPTTVNREMNPS